MNSVLRIEVSRRLKEVSDLFIGIGQEKGLDKIYGPVLTDNRAMLRICDELGFHKRDLADGTTWVEPTLK